METIKGTIERITFNNEDNGWSVIQVSPESAGKNNVTMTCTHTPLVAGSSMIFKGEWMIHPKFGKQFKAFDATEIEPESMKSIEKYLSSGLIKGIGKAIAKRIVNRFKEDTLKVFDENIDSLIEINGISKNKLVKIKSSWNKYRDVKELMLFLKTYDLSTTYAVKLVKAYGKNAITKIQDNPYNLANDIRGIGFATADKMALNLGIDKNDDKRILSGIQYVLDQSRSSGHCFLTYIQILDESEKLLNLNLEDSLKDHLRNLIIKETIKSRNLDYQGKETKVYYHKAIYYAENYVAEKILDISKTKIKVQEELALKWVTVFCEKNEIELSEEQHHSIFEIIKAPISILTGGPGVGKTTTTNVLASLLEAMNLRVILAAPTGRAAQRMTEVIGMEAKTIHRLLTYRPDLRNFDKNEDNPLVADFIIVDESSMLDISLTASLFKAIKLGTQVLLIGDPDQLPSVGPGNVLKDLIHSEIFPVLRLNQVFRQARQSKIIQYAHQINSGLPPEIKTPFEFPEVWKKDTFEDCLFIDSDEATNEQLKVLGRLKNKLKEIGLSNKEEIFKIHSSKSNIPEYKSVQGDEKGNIKTRDLESEELLDFSLRNKPAITIPRKFQNTDFEKLAMTESLAGELKEIITQVPEYSSLHYNLTALDFIKKLQLEILPKYLGQEIEVQILCPMTKGMLGTHNLNRIMQSTLNPEAPYKNELQMGDKTFRSGDRVIQRKNNYDLGVFNGDIGKINEVDEESKSLTITYGNKTNSRIIEYSAEDIWDLDLAYAITIHKSQGSEFQVVILPLVLAHYNMLYRNLIYTGLTRAKKMAIFLGSRKALKIGIKNKDTSNRQTSLKLILKNGLS